MIIHVTGTQCAGKTYAVKPFLDRDDVAYWDILAFYNKYQCIDEDGMMDWEKWRATESKIQSELCQFLKENSNKKIQIIESGSNFRVNTLLATFPDVTIIKLTTPNEYTISKRAKDTGISIERALSFRRTYMNKFDHPDLKKHTTDEATALIQEALDKPPNIVNYYLRITGEQFVSQVDTPNRVSDQERISMYNGLTELGDPYTEFYTKKGTLIARGYLRIVYGDHGPYIEFLPQHMMREEWVTSKKKSHMAWYDECQPRDHSRCKLYVQKRTVQDLPNPPKGVYSVNNNRKEGYADYRVGRLYISPDDVTLSHR